MNYLRRNQFYLWLIVPLTLMGLYLITHARTITGYADSDELLLAGYRLALAHPPGYPWLIYLLHLVSKEAGITNYLSAGNALNSIITGINLVISWFTLKEFIYLVWPKISNKNRYISSVLTLWFWGISYSVWLHATVLEVFPLAQTGILLTFYLLFCWWHESGRKKTYLWVLTSLIGSLSFFYHPLTLLPILPLFLYCLWFKQESRQMAYRSLGITILVVIIAGWITFQGSVYLALQNNNTLWLMKNNIGNWLNFWARQTYADNGSAIETYIHDWSPIRIIHTLFLYVRLLVEDYTFLGIIFLGGGLYYGLKQNRIIISLVLLGLILSGFGLFLYLKFPLPQQVSEIEYFWGTWLRYRMNFAASITVLLLTTGFWSKIIQQIEVQTLRLQWSLLVIVLLFFGVMTGFRYSTIVTHQDNFVAVLSELIFQTLPSDAWVIIDHDWYFSWQLLQELKAIPATIQLIGARLPTTFPRQLSEEGCDYARITHGVPLAVPLAAYLIRNDQDVYLFSPDLDLVNNLGLEGNPFYGLPVGYLINVGKKLPKNTSFNYTISEQLGGMRPQLDSWWLKGTAAQLSAIHTFDAYLFSRLGDKVTAKAHESLAQNLTTLPETKHSIAEVTELGNSLWQKDNSYAAYVPVPAEEYLTQAQMAYDEGNSEKAHYFLLRSLLLNPNNPNACLKLRQF